MKKYLLWLLITLCILAIAIVWYVIGDIFMMSRNIDLPWLQIAHSDDTYVCKSSLVDIYSWSIKTIAYANEANQYYVHEIYNSLNIFNNTWWRLHYLHPAWWRSQTWYKEIWEIMFSDTGKHVWFIATTESDEKIFILDNQQLSGNATDFPLAIADNWTYITTQDLYNDYPTLFTWDQRFNFNIWFWKDNVLYFVVRDILYKNGIFIWSWYRSYREDVSWNSLAVIWDDIYENDRLVYTLNKNFPSTTREAFALKWKIQWSSKELILSILQFKDIENNNDFIIYSPKESLVDTFRNSWYSQISYEYENKYPCWKDPLSIWCQKMNIFSLVTFYTSNGILHSRYYNMLWFQDKNIRSFHWKKLYINDEPVTFIRKSEKKERLLFTRIGENTALYFNQKNPSHLYQVTCEKID
jgi:hypothetical protein